MTSYEERAQSIKRKRYNQGVKDLYIVCGCGKKAIHHTGAEVIQCKKAGNITKQETRGKIMNDKQIEKARLSRD